MTKIILEISIFLIKILQKNFPNHSEPFFHSFATSHERTVVKNINTVEYEG